MLLIVYIQVFIAVTLCVMLLPQNGTSVLGFSPKLCHFKLNVVQVVRTSALGDDRKLVDMQVENDGPKVSVASLEDAIVKMKSVATSKFDSTNTFIDKKNRDGITFSSLSLQDLTEIRERVAAENGTTKKTSKVADDLNGIQPYTPFLFATVSGFMSAAGWQIARYLAAHFAVQYLNSDLYPVQRLAVVFRNVVVGICTLFSGFCGAVSLGLICLGVVVTIGVIKGELDPTKVLTSSTITNDSDFLS